MKNLNQVVNIEEHEERSQKAKQFIADVQKETVRMRYGMLTGLLSYVALFLLIIILLYAK